MGVLRAARLPRLLVRAEGVSVAASSMIVYFWGDHSWWLLVVLALAPDLSMVAYAAGPRVGAAAYYLAHTYALPAVVGAVGVVAEADAAVAVALIWATHIGVDRAIGYGLSTPADSRTRICSGLRASG